ncbi:helix-turn-helix transcriptional regulator [Nocardioides sp. W3-2-3]|nr:helix-turn-helix transcriptional regulator [Nocardioides convexus]
MPTTLAARPSATPTTTPTAAPDLRSQFAAHPIPVHAGTTLRRILFATLDRADRVGPEHAEIWEQAGPGPRPEPHRPALDRALRRPREPHGDRRLRRAQRLRRDRRDSPPRLGQDRLARLQHRAGVALETDPSMPWTTTVVRRLIHWDLQARLEGKPSKEVSEDVATTCAVIAQNLLFADIDPDRATAPITSVREPAPTAGRGHRRAVAGPPEHHRVQPVGPLRRRPARPRPEPPTARRRSPPSPDSIAQCQEWCRDRERDQVAREIRHLVAVSGASQREFASRIGTSPSRLSTYVRGTVTPSAAMLLRIQRASRLLQRQATRQVLAPSR